MLFPHPLPMRHRKLKRTDDEMKCLRTYHIGASFKLDNTTLLVSIDPTLELQHRCQNIHHIHKAAVVVVVEFDSS